MMSFNRTIRALRISLAISLLAVWWGGFTFYSVVVVHTGHRVLKSKVRQGFITQQVTNQLNILGVVTLAVLIWEMLATREDEGSPVQFRMAMVTWAIMTVTLVLLFLIHPCMDSLLDPENRTVVDEQRFYRWHGLYLVVSTIQWLAGWTHLILLTQSCDLTSRFEAIGRRP